MKMFCLALCATMLSVSVNAQIIREQTSPQAIASQIPGFTEVSSINTVTLAYTPATPSTSPTPVDGDTTTEGNGIYDYGTILPASISMSAGNLTTTSAGKVWTVRIYVPNALNIGLTFTQFNLSPTAEMYIYNDAKTILNNQIKKGHFTNSDTVAISSMNGDAIIIYVVEPNNFGNFQSSLTIGEVVGGYRTIDDVGEMSGAQYRTTSINCIPDVQCSPYQMSARAVARISTPINSTTVGLCTGTLINNEQWNGRAYLLTAFHCIDHNDNGVLESSEINSLRNATFQFQFWRTYCNSNTNGTGIQFNGAILRASNHATDMVLLELINQPGIGDRISYAGWNRQSSSPPDAGSYIIHHPSGQNMRYTQTSTVHNFIFNSDYWQAFYSNGVVAPGSSGSALFNERNQITGQLKGGWSSCTFDFFSDRYGKFNKSWDQGNLQPWLSPVQNLQSINTFDLSQVIIQGSNEISCSYPEQYIVVDGIEGCTYQWSVSNNLQIVSGQNTPTVSIVANINNNTDFIGTITCTLTTPNKGRIRTLIVEKTVTFPSTVVKGYYSAYGSNNTYPLQENSDGVNEVQPYTTFVTITSQDITPTSMSLVYGHPTSWQWIPNNKHLIINMPPNEYAIFRMTGTTSCGTAEFDFGFFATFNAPYRMAPNPVTSSLNVEVDKERLSKLKISKSDDQDIRELVIIDKTGNIWQRKTYAKGTRQIALDVSALKADLYLLRISNGKNWTTLRFNKQ